jgi:predicted AAA+ superfamily ATPase
VTRGDYLPRLVDSRLRDLFAELPAIMLVGPRATGKTTTAAQHAATVVRLDQPAEAGAFLADPDAALRGMPEPVLLDEWQAVPAVLGAVKRAVDSDFRPGRFLLTGSARADLDAETWPGTGRVVRMSMYGLSRREVEGRADGPSFIDRLISNDDTQLVPPDASPDLTGYIDLALRGGFPEAVLGLSDKAHAAWTSGYLDQLLTRDVSALADRRPRQLRRYFEAVALNTAGVVDHKTLYDAAQIDRNTAVGYDSLLDRLFVVEQSPAWLTNRLSRLVKTSKRYVVDPSLAAAALKLDTAAVLRDSDLLGRLLDTFVAAQIRPEIGVSESQPRLYHLRDKNGRREVDLIVEVGAHGIVGIEVKATSAPRRDDAKHLIWLRDELQDRFIAGAVMHTGPRSYLLDDRIRALPIATMWAPPSQ